MCLHRMMPLVALAAFLLSPTSASAQNAGLSGLLLQFFAADNQTLLVSTPLSPFRHLAAFGSQPNIQATMSELNRSIASQLTTFPLGSSSGGFAYTFDPALGVFSRSTESFGPLFAERALTIGKGKIGFGTTYLRSNFDSFEGQNLHNGDIQFFLIHADINRDGSHFQPWFEGDRIRANLFLDLTSETTVFFGNYGVTDKLDVGFALPYLRLDMTARVHETIFHFSTEPEQALGLFIHTFKTLPDGLTPIAGDERDEVRSGAAEGLGDLVVRAKYQIKKVEAGGVAVAVDLRLPTGDEQELLGSGSVQAKLFAIASSSGKKFSPHVNLGYTFSRGGSAATGRLPDEINYTVGFDTALHPRVTLTADVIGRTLRDIERLQVDQELWEYATRFSGLPGGVFINPVIALPRLDVVKGDLNVLLGALGLKFNPAGNFLISANVLLSQGKRGLQDYVTPVVSVDYSF